jgi:very-short-patch-repair endonuclease
MKITPGSKEYFAFLNEVREYYQGFEHLIIKSTIRGQWQNTYAFDWASSFSDAEYQAWQVIRTIGRCLLYPQYPVDKYFVDFGNPYYKIALEVDGKEFHLDKEKDKARDSRLLEFGWKTFRVTGAEAYKQIPGIEEINHRDWDNLDPEQREIVTDWFMNTVEGVVEALTKYYFDRDENDSSMWLYVKTLEQHRLIDFYL